MIESFQNQIEAYNFEKLFIVQDEKDCFTAEIKDKKSNIVIYVKKYPRYAGGDYFLQVHKNLKEEQYSIVSATSINNVGKCARKIIEAIEQLN